MTLLPHIIEKSAVDLATLPALEVQVLQQQVEATAKQLKACKERLASAISIKYASRASSVRESLSKETGIIRFVDDGVSVVADIAKKPQWDQEQLAEIAEKIRASGEDPAEFMEISYKVAESKYTAWPEALRQQFSSARTLNLGKQAFLLTDDKESQS